jgi:outer membrane protein
MLFNQRSTNCLRRPAVAVLAVCVFAFGPAVFASEQAKPPQQPVPQRPAVTGAATSTLNVSADEAVKMALENNLGLRADRLGPEIETFGVAQARAAYAPTLTSLTTSRSSTNPPTDFLTGASNILTDDRFSANAGIEQLVPWGGGRYTVGWDASRSTSSNESSRFNPTLNSNLAASYRQPLLRGFTIDAFRQNVMQSEKRQEIADIQLRQSVTQTSRAVRNAYFNLLNAIGQHEVALKSLELSQTSLKNNERRVEVGTMAQIDIVQAQAEVAANEEQVIVAEGRISSAEDLLRTLIMNPSQPDFWTTKLVPSERPTMVQTAIDLDGAIANALANRTDIAQVRKQIEQTDVSVKFLRNQKMPALDVLGNYNLAGTAGTQREFDFASGIIPPPILRESDRSFTSALRDVFGNEFKTWSVQLNLSYPLGTSVADAGLAQARLQREQQLTNLRDLETVIVAQVRDAARQVFTALKRIETSRRARDLAQRNLEAEEKRLQVGIGNSFQLFRTQRDFSLQLQNELNAIIDYNRALINFEAVQTVPLGGGF